MGLVDLFRPRYRHSDVSVRTEAVRALSADDAVVLTTIAKSDRDAGVRRLAIEKLGEAEVLADIAASEADSAVRSFAKARAAELWSSTACSADGDAAAKALSGLLKLGDQASLVDVAVRAANPAVKKRALSELRDPKALAELAKGSAPTEVRLDAVARIDDAEVLRALAIDVAQKEIALAAVEKLDDVGRLEQVALKAKNKAARQRARKIVSEMQEAEEAAKPRVADELKRRRAEKSQLVRDLEAHAESFDFGKLAAQVKAAEQAFAEIGDTEDDLDERFKKSAARFWQRKEHAERQAAGLVAKRGEARDAEPRRAEADAARAAAKAQLDEQATTDRAERGKGERAERNERAATPADSDAAIATGEAKAAREEQDRKRAEAAAKAKEAADARAARAAEDAERGKQIAASLAAMVDEMEQILAADTSTLEGGRVIDRTLSQAQKAFEQLGKVPSDQRTALGDRYGKTRGKLVVLVKDLREAEDWQRWANVPRAEALITEAKAMLEGEETPPDLGNKLKALQARWKEIGSLPQRRSKELWETFKAACDQVYDKVKGVRAVEAAGFAEVAAVKERLIAEAEALSESTDWAATAEKLKALQNEWKTSGHLPRKQGEELWKKFRAACDQFFERRKPMLEAARNQEQQNLAAKRALVTKVQSIVSSAGEGDWGKAINGVKDAQRQWKEIGFVPRADADAIYREFRAACDALFAKRDEARDAEANERRAALEGVSGEIDAVLELEDGAEAAARAAAVRAKVTELSSDGSRPSIELAGRLDRMISHVIAKHPEAVRGTPLDPTALRKRRDALVARAAELLPKESAAVAEKPSDVAGALRSAMRQNAFSGLRFSGRDPAEVVEELRAEWAETGPLFDDSDRDQQTRFDDTIARVLAAAGATERKRGEGSEGRDGRDDGAEPGERGRRRRERKGRGEGDGAQVAAPASSAPADQADAATPGAAAAPAVAAGAAVVTAAAVAQAVEAAAAHSAPAARPAPRTEPLVEAQDAAWDLDDHRPQPKAKEESPPGAGELADDGAPPGDGLDSGWD